jgi:anaphase-promoting complex subunit 2
MKWHRTWTPKLEYVCHPLLAVILDNMTLNSLGPTVTSAFNLSFQTHLFAILPPLFATGFKALCSYTLSPPDTSTLDVRSLWIAFDTLGLVDRYESLIASVGYDCIDEHVENICAGNWDRPFLEELSDWMSKKIVPWLIMTYAPKATTGELCRYYSI